MTQVSQIASFRLTQAHRADILKAIIQNWTRQNPAPSIDESIQDDFVTDILEQYSASSTVQSLNSMFKSIDESTKQFMETFLLKTNNVSTDVTVKLVSDEQNESSEFVFQILPQTLERLGFNNFPQPFYRGKAHYLSTVGQSSTWPNSKQKFTLNHPNWGVIPILSSEQDMDEYVQTLTTDEQDFLTDAFSRTDRAHTDGVYYPVSLYSKIPLTVNSKHPFFTHLKKVRRSLVLWQRERKQLIDEVTDTLSQFNTSKQLLEGWPDIAGYLPPHLTTVSAIKLPAVAINRLNERLGLV